MTYSDDHLMLRDAVAGFLAEYDGIAKLRAGEALVSELGELGWSGLLVDEAHGGSGMDMVSACVLAQEVGRHLALTPVLSSAIVSSFALSECGNDQQKRRWLPGICEGTALITTNAGAPAPGLDAQRLPEGGVALSGNVDFIPDLSETSSLLLCLDRGTDSELCMLSGDLAGVQFKSYATLDQRPFGKATFRDVVVPPEAVMGCPNLDRIRSFGALLFASEQYGCAQAAFDLTVAYLQERKQFGRRIGSFQALQHRAGILFSELAMSEALIISAAQALDSYEPGAHLSCSMAKAKAGRVALDVANESIQMHGGIGMTEEYDAGLYLKRIAVSEKLYGDYDYHTDQVARLSGF